MKKAGLLLNRAFVEYYPKFANARAPDGSEYISWSAHVVTAASPALALCERKASLAHIYMHLAARGEARKSDLT